MVEGRETSLQKGFCKQMEAIVNENEALKSLAVEVLNFAVSGYSTAQSYLIADRVLGTVSKV
jgi:hypothetical protein